MRINGSKSASCTNVHNQNEISGGVNCPALVSNNKTAAIVTTLFCPNPRTKGGKTCRGGAAPPTTKLPPVVNNHGGMKSHNEPQRVCSSNKVTVSLPSSNTTEPSDSSDVDGATPSTNSLGAEVMMLI